MQVRADHGGVPEGGVYAPQQIHDCDAAVLVRRYLPGLTGGSHLAYLWILPEEAHSMARKASLVGINAYSARPLDGCINDVTELERLLLEQRRAGPADIRRLIDGDAGTDAENGQDECLCLVDHATRGPLRDDALQRLYHEMIGAER